MYYCYCVVATVKNQSPAIATVRNYVSFSENQQPQNKICAGWRKKRGHRLTAGNFKSIDQIGIEFVTNLMCNRRNQNDLEVNSQYCRPAPRCLSFSTDNSSKSFRPYFSAYFFQGRNSKITDQLMS